MLYQMVLGEDASCFCIKNINIFRIFRRECVLYVKAYGFNYDTVDYMALNLLCKLSGRKHIDLCSGKRIIPSSCLKTNSQVNFL